MEVQKEQDTIHSNLSNRKERNSSDYLFVWYGMLTILGINA
jgi:hypothetical protein